MTITVDDWQSEDDTLPARHQRRILVLPDKESSRDDQFPARSDDIPSLLYRSVISWQRQYVGGVFVDLDGTSAERLVTLRALERAGCTLQAVHFHRLADVPGSAALATLVDCLLEGIETPGSADGADLTAVTGMLLVGATDVVAPGGRVGTGDIAAARIVARTANRLLGDDFFPLPQLRTVHDMHGKATPTAQAEALRDAESVDAIALVRLLAEGNELLAWECEDRTGLLRAALHHLKDDLHSPRLLSGETGE
ncbi:hypothetical protein [Streptomyces bauhiniae]|uniref:hypothetical protein n=1 Tax=Streptomyces bauhiniae TaxID=2340725 RepID=UPI0035DA8D85